MIYNKSAGNLYLVTIIDHKSITNSGIAKLAPRPDGKVPPHQNKNSSSTFVLKMKNGFISQFQSTIYISIFYL